MAGADRDAVERKRCVVVDENSADVSVAVVCRGFIAFYRDVFKRNVRADTCIDSARRTAVCNRRIVIGNRSADHRQFTVIPNSDTACSNTCIAFDIDVGQANNGVRRRIRTADIDGAPSAWEDVLSEMEPPSMTN